MVHVTWYQLVCSCSNHRHFTLSTQLINEGLTLQTCDDLKISKDGKKCPNDLCFIFGKLLGAFSNATRALTEVSWTTKPQSFASAFEGCGNLP